MKRLWRCRVTVYIEGKVWPYEWQSRTEQNRKWKIRKDRGRGTQRKWWAASKIKEGREENERSGRVKKKVENWRWKTLCKFQRSVLEKKSKKIASM